MKKILILGSASQGRQEILQNIGYTDFEIISSNIDETPKRGEKPFALAKRLAFEKNKALQELVKQKHGHQCVIITGDTVAVKGRDVLHKAETDEDVRAYMNKISGTNHRIYSGICVHDCFTGKTNLDISETRLKVKRLTELEIEMIVKSKQGIGKAGGYEVSGLFSAFVIKMVGSATNVKGLDAYKVRNFLTSCGVKPKLVL